MNGAVEALLAEIGSRPSSENHAEWMLFRHSRKGRGSQPALHYQANTYTFGQLATAASGFATWLRSFGIGPGHAVLLVLPDCPTLAAAYFGTVATGAVAIIVNPVLAIEDLLHVAQLSGAVLAIVYRDAMARVFPLQHLAGMRTVRPAGDTWLHASELADGVPIGDTSDCVVFGSRAADAYGLLTSGSTGRPKLIVHRHVDILYGFLGFARDILRIAQSDRLACAAKMSTGYGLGSSLLMPLLAGASSILVSAEPGPALLDAIERHACTLLLAQPRFLAEATNDPDARRKLRSVRLAVTGGEPLGKGLQLRWTGSSDVELLDAYGNTEVGFLYVTNRPGDTRQSSVGRPIAGLDVELVDNLGDPVEQGQFGSLRVRGPSVISAYRGRLDASRAFEGGWFLTSDVFSRDADGYLYVHGRTDHFIKLGCGDWVNPVEVEKVLLRHGAVNECAVTGTPDPTGLTILKAVVVAKTPSSDRQALAAELGLLVQAHWPSERFKHLDHVEFVPSLPKTVSGKLDRASLEPQSMTEFSYRC